MEDTLPPLEHKALSASRIKVFEDCSWLYWAQYHLKLPQNNNEGAKKGTVCHLVFEVLLNPRHKKHYNVITKNNHVNASQPIVRLIRKHLKKLEIDTDPIFENINDMILVGLNNEFFVKGGQLLGSEYQFSIEDKQLGYLIKGFIDKPVKKGKEVLIDDFKSSKQKFEGESINSNIQGMMYSLAASKIWPKLKPIMRFIFLRFPEEPFQVITFSKEVLSGFEHYLAAIQKKIDAFNIEDAKSNFAYDKDDKKGGFTGKIMCGFAKKRGQLKKDGTPMWHCPYKFAFDYYCLEDADGNIIKTSFNNDLVPKGNEKVTKKNYEGCPRHKEPL